MFSSGVIASSIPSVYSADFTVGSFTDKAGTRYGFVANPNSTPAWQQQGSGTAISTMYGGLDPVIYTTGGTDYQIVAFRQNGGALRLVILHPDQSDTNHLGQLFSSLSTNLGTINYSDISTTSVLTNYGNPAYVVSTYNWTTQSSSVYTQVTDIIGTTASRTLTIEE